MSSCLHSRHQEKVKAKKIILHFFKDACLKLLFHPHLHHSSQCSLYFGWSYDQLKYGNSFTKEWLVGGGAPSDQSHCMAWMAPGAVRCFLPQTIGIKSYWGQVITVATIPASTVTTVSGL